MDEDEYEEYCRAIDWLDTRQDSPDLNTLVQEQLRDEEGIRVPGCYVALPLKVPDIT